MFCRYFGTLRVIRGERCDCFKYQFISKRLITDMEATLQQIDDGNCSLGVLVGIASKEFGGNKGS